MNAKEFVNFVNDEFDVELLEMMKDLIDERIVFVKTMIDMANKKEIKGFRK